MQNLQQLRAEHAFSFMKDHYGDKDLENIIMKLPVMFQTNGLLATWAFLLVKKSYDVLNNLQNHLQSVPSCEVEPNSTSENIFNVWIQDDFNFDRYCPLINELIAYSSWLKRASEALTVE